MFGNAPAGLATHGTDLDVTICCRVLPSFLVRLEQTPCSAMLLLVSPPTVPTST
jgi:hypothetical protein